MDFVVDANILFAALIKDSVTADLFVQEEIRLFAPEFIFREFEKYHATIMAKTDRSESDFEHFMVILLKRIHVVPREEFDSHISQAKKTSPDIKDVPYFALAMKKNIPIWSNDKQLESQDLVVVYSTSKLIEIIKQ